jgi:predicted aspartyl protease
MTERVLVTLVLLGLTQTPIRLPVERASNVFFARTTINGAGPFWFTIDTGATLTVIDPSAAARLGLVVRQAGRRLNIGIASGDVAVGVTSGATVTVGDAPPFTPSPLYVVGVRGNSGYLRHTVDGVLGTDFLKSHVVRFDYRASRVTLDAAGPARGDPVPFTIDRNILVAASTLTLPDGEPLPARLLVDTGSNAALTLTSPFVRAHRLASRFPSLQMSATVGINGMEVAPVVTLKAASIGAAVFDAPNASLSRATTGLNASEEYDGIIGGELLRRFTLTVDYPRGRLLLERPVAPVSQQRD